MRNGSETGFGVFNDQLPVSVQQFEELEKKFEDLKTRVDTISPELGRSTDIPVQNQDSTREIVSDKVADIMWNKIFLVSSFAAESVTTSSSTEDVTAKEVDSTEGMLFDARRPSKFRMSFYLGSGQTNSTVYILSPAVSNTQTPTVPIKGTERSYVGIKIVQTVVYLVSYNSKDLSEKLLSTNVTITDDTTHIIEFNYRPGQSSDIYFDNVFMGSIENNLTKDIVLAFYPYLTSVKSASGSVNLTIENYQFMQERT